MVWVTAEIVHYINLRVLKKVNKQIDVIVVDFISDYLSDKHIFLQIKYANIKDYNKQE